MTAPFVGEVKAFAFNFAPRGYMVASGQLLPIAQYTALFAILGTTYGGNGVNNFALPNLNGTVAIGNGNGAGLSPNVLGETLGTETETLLSTQMPQHTHPLSGATLSTPNGAQNVNTPTNDAYFGLSGPGMAYGSGAANTQFNAVANQLQGGGQAHANLQPYLTVNFCVAVQGVFPIRS